MLAVNVSAVILLKNYLRVSNYVRNAEDHFQLLNAPIADPSFNKKGDFTKNVTHIMIHIIICFIDITSNAKYLLNKFLAKAALQVSAKNAK